MATGLVFAAVATVVLVGAFGLPSLAALAVGELVLAAWPLGVARNLGLPLRALGLRRPRALVLISALLVGCTAWYLNLQLAQLLRFDGGSFARTLDRAVQQPPLPLAIATIGVMPAVCEEILFRGCVQRALASRLYPAGAIVLTSLLFAAYHMSLVQLVPAFSLGLMVGTLSLRADSILPAMLAHFLNNTVVILISRGDLNGVATWIGGHGVAALAVCIACTAGGLGLALGARA